MLRNGTPWFLKRSVDLLPAAAILMVIESIKLIIEKIKPAKAKSELSFLYQIESDPAKIELLLAS
jgi:hypothetical protein